MSTQNSTMQCHHKTSQCNVNTKHHNAMSTQNSTMQCHHKTAQCNVNTKHHNAMSTKNITMQCQHKTAQCNVNTKHHNAMSTYISTRNYYDFLLRVLNVIYFMSDGGYYGRNMLNVLSGLKPFVVVNGKTYVCVDTLIGRRLRQTDWLSFVVVAVRLIRLQHREKWRCMVWSEGLRRGVEWKVLLFYLLEEGHWHIISVH